MKYLWTGKALEEFIFFECLYFSQYDTRMLLFVFIGLEIGHPLSTYATGMEGENPECVQVRTGRGELKNRS